MWKDAFMEPYDLVSTYCRGLDPQSFPNRSSGELTWQVSVQTVTFPTRFRHKDPEELIMDFISIISVQGHAQTLLLPKNSPWHTCLSLHQWSLDLPKPFRGDPRDASYQTIRKPVHHLQWSFKSNVQPCPQVAESCTNSKWRLPLFFPSLIKLP